MSEPAAIPDPIVLGHGAWPADSAKWREFYE